MEHPLTYLKQRAGEDWLIGCESSLFNSLTEQLFQELIPLSKRKTPPKILLAEQNPVRFLAAFLAAVAANCPVFLCNPNWVEDEWQQVFDLVQPDLIFGQAAYFPPPHSPTPPHSPSKLIMIPTGGSSGKIRFAIHTWETLMASVHGFHQYFGEKPINSFCVLPLYHVSGLMQFLRSFTTGGQVVILPFKALVEGQGYPIDPTDFFISLVPTQLARMIMPQTRPFLSGGGGVIEVGENQDTMSQAPPFLRGVGGDRDNTISLTSTWLSRFRAVLLGGAPAWPELLEQARHHSIPLALTYGMTETASQVVTLKPEDFLSGNNSCGQVLPHARITIRSSTGEILDANQTGMITIQANSLALGYYHDGGWGDKENLSLPKSKIQNLESDDLGFFDEQGYLTIIGRHSNKIITGGENVFAAEVEAAIFATQLVADVCVIGLPDRYWGQVVTAVYVPSSPEVSPTLLQVAIEDKLSKFKRPKHWVQVKSLPRNGQGKVNYEKLKDVATAALELTPHWQHFL